ncbi:MAG: imidazolonepropionase [Cytophagaceae bacterium]|nr:imidazolonepropionase [Cytophagaceae bacterium]MBK9935164.1 imidazolonepropionase [Cytophagaceae bacterium]MBL0301608.1 imidazolonepropionase [Cytophagaceae bacterium]MBL0324432.1 imidazolonepropionase [Cytophagaceae bacterium]
MKLIGPFSQILTLDNIPLKGAVKDEALEILPEAGVLVEHGMIIKTGDFNSLRKEYKEAEIEEVDQKNVLLPGFVDCHTHSCFAGSRAMDFAERNAGSSYLEIAQQGGGIWSTVTATRKSSAIELKQLTESRVNGFLKNGITTIEIKSGYGLSVEEEIKILKVINQLDTSADVVTTCLAAHVKPRDFDGSTEEYLDYLIKKLLPEIKNLTQRIDIFTEKSAFGIEESTRYLQQAKEMGFKITVHADQFTAGSAQMAVKLGALSADHLEASTDEDIKILANSETVAVALPGASIGLGEPFAPARKLLDAGACVAIASDYNPGSAPMGDLLTQASILATYQKLSTAEVLAGLTFRAAKALDLYNIGKISSGFQADFQAYSCVDYREILYHQGSLKPEAVWKKGKKI